MKGNSNLRSFMALLVVAVMAVMAIGPIPAAGADIPNPGVIPPQAHPYGHTYSEWSNMWWQWAFSIPWHDANGNVLNPVADETGAKCGVGQSGRVWFLTVPLAVPGAPSHVVRTLYCAMPAGKGIFLSIQPWSNDNYSQDWTQPCYPNCFDLRGLRDQLESLFETTFASGCPGCSVEVDGTPLRGIFGLEDRIGYGNTPYSVTVPNDNLYNYVGFPVGAVTVYPQISDGWYVMLAPLSAGQHTIHIHTASPDWFDWDITYHLTVGR